MAGHGCQKRHPIPELRGGAVGNSTKLRGKPYLRFPLFAQKGLAEFVLVLYDVVIGRNGPGLLSGDRL